MTKKDFIPFTHADEKLVDKIVEGRAKVEIKYPLTFLLLTTFGFVSILYGFEKIIDKVPLFVNDPWILLAVGLATLIITGTAFKKL